MTHLYFKIHKIMHATWWQLLLRSDLYSVLNIFVGRNDMYSLYYMVNIILRNAEEIKLVITVVNHGHVSACKYQVSNKDLRIRPKWGMNPSSVIDQNKNRLIYKWKFHSWESQGQDKQLLFQSLIQIFFEPGCVFPLTSVSLDQIYKNKWQDYYHVSVQEQNSNCLNMTS